MNLKKEIWTPETTKKWLRIVGFILLITVLLMLSGYISSLTAEKELVGVTIFQGCGDNFGFPMTFKYSGKSSVSCDDAGNCIHGDCFPGTIFKAYVINSIFWFIIISGAILFLKRGLKKINTDSQS